MIEFTQKQIETMRRTICEGLTDAEIDLFVEACKRSGLDPFARQIYAVKRGDSRRGGKSAMTIQTGIDGFRSIAERTSQYAGQIGPHWCGDDGVWRDVWLDAKPPRAAKVEVVRKDFAAPLVGVALWAEYAQQYGLWSKFPSVMIAKCAESIALRRAFPQELSGLYTSEEMSQADEAPTTMKPTPKPETRAQSKAEPKPEPEPKMKEGPKSTMKMLVEFARQIEKAETEAELDAVTDHWAARIGMIPAKAQQRAHAYADRHRASLTDGEVTEEVISLAQDIDRLFEMETK